MSDRKTIVNCIVLYLRLLSDIACRTQPFTE